MGITTLILKQLNNFFVEHEEDRELLSLEIPFILEKCEIMFSSINDKYYDSRKVNLYNSSQYASFLYLLSNHIWNKYQDRDLCDRIFYLNKIMNNVDLFYEIDLPEVFYLEHPMSSVLGRARYGNFLSVSQGVTVGMNKMKISQFGDYVTLYPNSAVIGSCIIGNNVIVSIGTIIKDEIIPDNSIVFGISPNLTIIKKTEDEIHEIISDRWKF